MPKTITYSLAVLLAGVALSLGASFAYAAPPYGFAQQTVVSGLVQPTDMTMTPDGRFLVTQKGGQLMVVQNGTLLKVPALNLASTSQGVTTGGDRGLLSVVLDPQFAQNGYVYLAYTTGNSHERLSRFTMQGNTIDPATEKVLLENPAVWSGFLNAVTLRYDPADGKLYATFGSDGLGSNAQDLSVLSGKVLRINLDGSLPPDNPYVSVPGAQGAIFAIGFRNPWKLNIAADGTVWVGDVGENTWEEVDHVFKGQNYGWPQAEGTLCSQRCGGLTPPVYEYNHNGKSSAIMGGDFYKGASFPAPYNTDYFYGDFIQGWIGTLSLNAQGQVVATSTFDTGLGHLSALNYEPDGCLYYLIIAPGSMGRYCYTGSSPDGSKPNVTSDVTYAAAGTLFNATTKVVSSTNLQNVLIDNEIWVPNGGSPTSISKTYTTTGINLTAGEPYLMNWTGTFNPDATIKVGVFSADWSTLYGWNDDAARLSSSTSRARFVDNVTVQNDSVSPSSPLGLKTEVAASGDAAVMLDTEIYNESGVKVLQQFEPLSLSGGAPKDVPWSVTAPSVPGNYTVKVGVFSPDWSALYSWDDAAAHFTVTGSVAPTFVISTLLPADTLPPSSRSVLTTQVTATEDLPNALVDTEVYDQNGTQVFQNLVSTNLLANRQFIATTTMPVPSVAGPYTVKVGVFSKDWQTLYVWQNRALVFYSGTPPPAPQLGHIYPITVEVPQDGAAVSGTIELKALISGLDINSYDLWWRTGNGDLKNLDTDPITESFKHAWINFDPFTWMPDHRYPLTLVATDLSGNVIGSTTITVLH